MSGLGLQARAGPGRGVGGRRGDVPVSRDCFHVAPGTRKCVVIFSLPSVSDISHSYGFEKGGSYTSTIKYEM